LWLLRLRSGGYPRLVNVVAHKALMAAFGRDRRSVGFREMRAAVNDTPALRWNLPLVARAKLAALALVLLAIGVLS
jgi:MSHA biogenesis protein MshM